MRKNFAYINKETAMISQFVHKLEPYSPTSSRNKIESTKSDLPPLKLDWNEATTPPSPHVNKAIIEALQNNNNILNWYPELFSEELRKKLTEYTGRRSNEILVTNGSDDALELICKVFLDPGDHVVAPYPTYTHFLTYVESRGAILIKAEPENVFKSDVSSILQKVTPDTKLIYITNPNNPTGVLLSNKEIETILTIASNSIVVIDEAYFEFSGSSAASLIDKYSNLIITRTFSKAWAMAGLRVGYLMTNYSNIFTLSKVFNPKSVNVLAQIAATAALDDVKYCKSYVKEVEASKTILLDFFKSHGLEAFDSHANYIMVAHPQINKFLTLMEEENIYVRDRSSFKKLPNFFRITMGNADQTADLIRRLEKVFKNI